MTYSAPERWDTVVVPRRGLFDLQLGELWRYRDLIVLLLRRNLVVNYRQTILGPIWHVAQPLAATLVYTIVFGLIVRVPTDNISPSLFYLSGILVWNSFSANVTGMSDVFFVNMSIFGKVYFPRLAVPVATLFGNLFTSGIQLIFFLTLLFFEATFGGQQRPSIWIVISPVLLIANGLFAMGVGLVFSALTTRYRDLVPVMGAGLQLWMYATPVIYPLSQIPASWHLVLALNPLSTSVELFRAVALGHGSVSLAQILISFAVIAGALVVGLVLFARAEQNAADTV